MDFSHQETDVSFSEKIDQLGVHGYRLLALASQDSQLIGTLYSGPKSLDFSDRPRFKPPFAKPAFGQKDLPEAGTARIQMLHSLDNRFPCSAAINRGCHQVMEQVLSNIADHDRRESERVRYQQSLSDWLSAIGPEIDTAKGKRAIFFLEKEGVVEGQTKRYPIKAVYCPPEANGDPELTLFVVGEYQGGEQSLSNLDQSFALVREVWRRLGLNRYNPGLSMAGVAIPAPLWKEQKEALGYAWHEQGIWAMKRSSGRTSYLKPGELSPRTFVHELVHLSLDGTLGVSAIGDLVEGITDGIAELSTSQSRISPVGRSEIIKKAATYAQSGQPIMASATRRVEDNPKREVVKEEYNMAVLVKALTLVFPESWPEVTRELYQVTCHELRDDTGKLLIGETRPIAWLHRGAGRREAIYYGLKKAINRVNAFGKLKVARDLSKQFPVAQTGRLTNLVEATAQVLLERNYVRYW